MGAAKAAMTGIVIKAAMMAVVILGCVLAARLASNHFVRSNPGWSRQKKEATHSLTFIAAVVVAAIFLIAIASR